MATAKVTKTTTHEGTQAFHFKPETVRHLYGSKSPIPEFRRTLVFTLDLLTFAGLLAGWNIDEESDLVTVTKRSD